MSEVCSIKAPILEMKINKRNLKESMADTAIALPIAWATSYISLLLMISFGVKDALLISAAVSYTHLRAHET